MMRNKRSEQARQELFEYAAQVLGNHYRNKAMSDNDRLEANLKRETEAFKASRRGSKPRLSMSKWAVA
ncbi:TPA: hypothetical protein ACPHXL_003498 [Vibrio alginolyticus]|jgi:hypothetical protein|uniref:hypothetical protein n=1 Tax=Vibrio alginolyticus TaxID=663 RepID=UPI0022787723|nr:hypothetical protein [Vibrio alginolyticus]WAE59660.1 hypothetical protein OPR71_24425 [Vibrio alginolyticus]